MSATNPISAVSSNDIRGIIEKLNNVDKDILTIEEIDMILELLEKTATQQETE